MYLKKVFPGGGYMEKRLTAVILTILLLSGCTMKIIPEPVDMGLIDHKDNSQTITKGDVAIAVKSSDAELYSYNLDGTVSAFSVTIDNKGKQEAIFDKDSFLLVDNEKRQYFPLTPEKVKEIIARDSYYLIPYPYVGFYYLEDYERASFYSTFTSQLPYYELYPQDIFTKALPEGPVIPGAKISGLLYFRIDLNGKKGVSLLVYRKGAPKSSPPEFMFPFRIE
jgi:hypothetical protein